MNHSTCCHCLTTAILPDDAKPGDLPAGWRSFTTAAGLVLTLCGSCRLAWAEDFLSQAMARIAALEAAMMTVRDIMRTDVPERLPYKTAGKGVVQ